MIYIVKFTFYTKSGFGSFKAVFKSKEEANHALSLWKEYKYDPHDEVKKTSKILKVLDEPKNAKEWMQLINKFVLPQSDQLLKLFNWIAEDIVKKENK